MVHRRRRRARSRRRQSADAPLNVATELFTLDFTRVGARSRVGSILLLVDERSGDWHTEVRCEAQLDGRMMNRVDLRVEEET